VEIDPVLLSRLQFGMTASFHIIFPCLIIGLAFYLTVAGWCVSEVGRQPWVVSGLVKTTDIVASPPNFQMAAFPTFIGAFYALLLLSAIRSLWWFIRRRPPRSTGVEMTA
jgi:cytochrome d ubiquinol oxidase subunit I